MAETMTNKNFNLKFLSVLKNCTKSHKMVHSQVPIESGVLVGFVGVDKAGKYISVHAK